MTLSTGFGRPVIVSIEEDGAAVRLVEERTYLGSKGDAWRIPAGFRTDFATIPAALSWAIAKLGLWTLAAIVHDLLCEGLNRWHKATRHLPAELLAMTVKSHGGIHTSDGFIPVPTASSVDADAIFYKIAREYRVDPVTASLLWVGVRWGALGNAARREGFMETFWPWLGLSLAFAPILIPATVFAVVGRAALRVARWVFGRTSR